jgi:hypothetical protein
VTTHIMTRYISVFIDRKVLMRSCTLLLCYHLSSIRRLYILVAMFLVHEISPRMILDIRWAAVFSPRHGFA